MAIAASDREGACHNSGTPLSASDSWHSATSPRQAVFAVKHFCVIPLILHWQRIKARQRGVDAQTLCLTFIEKARSALDQRASDRIGDARALDFRQFPRQSAEFRTFEENGHRLHPTYKYGLKYIRRPTSDGKLGRY